MDKFDISVDGFDMEIKNGDFVVKESTMQHQDCLLVAEPGNYLQSPGMGAGVFSHINNDESLESIKKQIQKTFESDGMTILKLEVKSRTEIDILANY